jgi:Flp pilus assembly protein TadG
MKRLRSERGASVVEMAAVATVLLTVLFGVIEVGRLILTYVTIAQAARAGARYAVVHGALRTGTGVNGPSGAGNDPAQVVTVVTNITSAAGLTTGGILTPIVTYPNGSNTVGSVVTVTVRYPYTPTLVWFLPLAVTLSSTTQGTICY